MSYDLTDCPDLSQFADLARPGMFGRDPAELRAELLDTISEAIAAQPRSLQREIGPSQVGHPCPRWLAYFFADVPPAGLQSPKWKAAVGTAIHNEFTDWMHRYNAVHCPPENPRFLADTRVYVGELYQGRPITGKLDAFDLWTCTVIDLKTASKTVMAKYGEGKPDSPQYDAQIDLYGVGARNAGLHVRNVGLLRVPRDGELRDAVWKVREHNPERAQQALARAGGIATMADTMGPAVASMMPAVEHHCGTCDWFVPGSTDLSRGCPGAETFQAQRNTPPAALTALAGTPTPPAAEPKATPNTALAAI